MISRAAGRKFALKHLPGALKQTRFWEGFQHSGSVNEIRIGMVPETGKSVDALLKAAKLEHDGDFWRGTVDGQKVRVQVVADPSRWGAAVLFAGTGDGLLEDLAKAAKEKGYRLLINGLLRGDHLALNGSATEKAIFSTLEIPPIAEADREKSLDDAMPERFRIAELKSPWSDETYKVTIVEGVPVMCTCPHYVFKAGPLGQDCKHMKLMRERLPAKKKGATPT